MQALELLVVTASRKLPPVTFDRSNKYDRRISLAGVQTEEAATLSKDSPPRTHQAMGEGIEQLVAQAATGRPATADKIAEAIVFLATDRSSFIYGAKLAVDVGRTAI